LKKRCIFYIYILTVEIKYSFVLYINIYINIYIYIKT
jgi:hypothetical protein